MDPLLFLVIALAGAVLYFWTRWRRALRAEFIRSYTLPQGLFDKLRQKRPELSLKDCQLAGHALRQFFAIYLACGFRHVSMPSQVTDDLWHEFILYTRNYQMFCQRAFGHFMHHTPAVMLGQAQQNNEGLKRCWFFACMHENINPRKATRLPLLFALDRKLGIADGFLYATDCNDPKLRTLYEKSTVHCAGEFAGGGAGCGTGGFGDSSAHGGGADGGSHGCSSGGCSGGCGGGGD